MAATLRRLNETKKKKQTEIRLLASHWLSPKLLNRIKQANYPDAMHELSMFYQYRKDIGITYIILLLTKCTLFGRHGRQNRTG